MAWLKFERGVSRHPKIVELAAELGVSMLIARGLVATLWDWCLTQAQDGHLGHISARALAYACEWDGDAQALLNALVTARLVDVTPSGLEVHGWLERAGGWREAQKKVRQRLSAPPPLSSGSEMPCDLGAAADVPGQSRDSPGTVPGPSPSPSRSLILIRGECEGREEPPASAAGSRGSTSSASLEVAALVDWWAAQSHPPWCGPPRASQALIARWDELVRLSRAHVRHDERAAGPSGVAAVAAYVERAWHDPWIRENRKGGGYLLGAGTDTRPGELEARLERILEGYDRSPESRRRREAAFAEAVAEIEDLPPERSVSHEDAREHIGAIKRALGIKA